MKKGLLLIALMWAVTEFTLAAEYELAAVKTNDGVWLTSKELVHQSVKMDSQNPIMSEDVETISGEKIFFDEIAEMHLKVKGEENYLVIGKDPVDP